MTNDKERFMRSLLWSREFQWFDLTGITKMKDGRLAKVELEILGTAASYEAIRATIISKGEGRVDTKLFRFSDHLEIAKVQPHASAKYQYRLAATLPREGKLKWFILVPEDTRTLTNKVEDWISLHE